MGESTAGEPAQVVSVGVESAASSPFSANKEAKAKPLIPSPASKRKSRRETNCLLLPGRPVFGRNGMTSLVHINKLVEVEDHITKVGQGGQPGGRVSTALVIGFLPG